MQAGALQLRPYGMDLFDCPYVQVQVGAGQPEKVAMELCLRTILGTWPVPVQANPKVR